MSKIKQAILDFLNGKKEGEMFNTKQMSTELAVPLIDIKKAAKDLYDENSVIRIPIKTPGVRGVVPYYYWTPMSTEKKIRLLELEVDRLKGEMAEQAKRHQDALDDLQLLVMERDEELERLNRHLAENVPEPKTFFGKQPVSTKAKPAKPKMKIAVFGLLPVQNNKLVEKFQDSPVEILAYKDVTDHQVRAIVQSCNLVLIHHNHAPHSYGYTTKSAGVPMSYVSGGLTAMVREINSVIQKNKLVAQ